MIRHAALIALLSAGLAFAAGAVQAQPLKLERVVVVMRHGVRPPTQPNAQLAKYSDKPWPDWSVAPGELTAHGGETVRLMGETLREAYRHEGVLPASGCAGPGQVTVWADGADERTRESGRILAEALEPGCGLKAPFADVQPRDPIFGGSDAGECHVDADKSRAAMAAAVAADPNLSRSLAPAYARLQAILAPQACEGGAGTCLAKMSGPSVFAGFPPAAGGLAEDLLLEYADGKPMSEVGWGRASEADIAAVMPIHERLFALIRHNTYASARHGAPMARVILDALDGRPASGGPQSGPDLRLLALAGHDTNLVLMASVFGLNWTLPDEPDGTAPSSVLAFELWSRGGQRFVRPVIYYETLTQLRELRPAQARKLPLQFADCASGPLGSCPLKAVRTHVEAILPPGCGAP